MGKRGVTQRDYIKLCKKYGALYATGLVLVLEGSFFLFMGLLMSFADTMGMLDILPVFILIGAISVPVGILLMIKGNLNRKREEKERKARALEREQRFIQSDIGSTDYMSGDTFEDFLAAVLKNMGYTVKKTKKTGDYGVDLILCKEETQIIVQAKRYKNKVSINAIQEISAAKNYYRIYNAWVITNNYFTTPAKNLAEQNHIKLIDRDGLAEMILQARSGAEQKIAG